MYTGGLLTPERATFDSFLSSNATQWNEPPSRSIVEPLCEEDEDSVPFGSTLTDSSSFSASLPTQNAFSHAISTKSPFIRPSSTISTPSRSLSASPAASFLSSFFNPAPEAPKPDDEGQMVAGYTLGSIIGYGSTSIIRRASSSSGAQAAVKIVRRSDLVKAGNAPQARKRLQHEAAVWATLSHEHILPLFSAVHTTYAEYFFTLYCPAGSLFDILKRDGNPALPQDDAGMMFRQIVRGMRYLHEVAHYVHRDMKLENVLVDETGVCKIADFGMSRKIGSVEEADDEQEEQDNFRANGSVHRAQTLNIASNKRHAQLNLVLNRHASTRHHRNSTSTNEPSHEFQPGSLPYAAPELLLPQTSEVLQPHPSQDIWALGVMLYALLTGRLPFHDSFEPRLQMKILNGTYDLPQGIGRGAERILQGCLNRNVAERWTIAMVDEVAWGVGWGAEGDDAKPAVIQEDQEYECDISPSRSRSHSRPGRLLTSDHDWQHDESRPRSSVEAASRRSSSRAKRSLSRAPVLTEKSTSSRGVSRSMSRHPPSSTASSTPTEPFSPSSTRSSATSSSGPYSAFFDDSALDTSPPASSPLQRGRRQHKFSHSDSRSPSPSVVPTTPLDALLVASPTEFENPDELHLDSESSRGRPALRSLDPERPQLRTEFGKHGIVDIDSWHHSHDIEDDRAFSDMPLARTGGVSSSAFVGQANDHDVTTATAGVGFSWRQRPGSSPPTPERLHQKRALEPFLNSSASSSSSSLALRCRSAENDDRR